VPSSSFETFVRLIFLNLSRFIFWFFMFIFWLLAVLPSVFIVAKIINTIDIINATTIRIVALHFAGMLQRAAAG